jgi:hypothetical protein
MTLYMRAPWEWVQPLKEAGYLKEYDAKRPVYLRLTKEVPGTVAGPRMWFLNLDDRLLSFHLPVKGGGHLSISRSHKPAVYLICERDAEGNFKRTAGTVCTHVDDLRMRATSFAPATSNETRTGSRTGPQGQGGDRAGVRPGEGRALLWAVVDHLKKFDLGVVEMSDDKGQLNAEFLGLETRTSRTGVKFGQKKYIETVLMPIDEVALKRCHKSVARTSQEPLAPELLPLYGTACGQLQWVLSSRAEEGFSASRAASRLSAPTVGDAVNLNAAIKRIRDSSHLERWIPTLDKKTLRLIGICDSSLGNLENSKTMGGRIVALASGRPENADVKVGVVLARAGRLHRVTTTSFDGETIIAASAASDCMGVSLLLEELQRGPVPSLFESVVSRAQSARRVPVQPAFPAALYSDGEGTVKATHNTTEIGCKRRMGDIASLREAIELGDIADLVHIRGDQNPADPLTGSGHVQSNQLSELLFKGTWAHCPPPP